jgi:hypothetical protein
VKSEWKGSNGDRNGVPQAGNRFGRERRSICRQRRTGQAWKVNCCLEGFGAGKAKASGYVREPVRLVATNAPAENLALPKSNAHVAETRLNNTRRGAGEGEKTWLAGGCASPNVTPRPAGAALPVLIAVAFGGLTLWPSRNPQRPRDFFQDSVSPGAAVWGLAYVSACLLSGQTATEPAGASGPCRHRNALA